MTKSTTQNNIAMRGDELAAVKFRQLRPNDANPRKTAASDADFRALKASIAAKGIEQPMLVRPLADIETPDNLPMFQIIAGGRRRAALSELLKTGEWHADWDVPVLVKHGVDDDEALDMALSENVVRAPLHPIDEFEAFARLFEDGLTVADIAASYGRPHREIEQRLALGGLDSDIREAWRKGDIREDHAKAFTLSRLPDVQREIFNRLWKQKRIDVHTIRAEIVGNTPLAVTEAMKLIGVDAFRAAGGLVTEDLFGDHHQFDKPELALALARARVHDECARLVNDEGWQWAVNADDCAAHGARWTTPIEPREGALSKEDQARMEKLQEILEENDNDKAASDEYDALNEKTEAAAWPKPDRKNFGCIIEIDSDAPGGIAIYRGYKEKPRLKGEAEPSANPAGKAAGAPVQTGVADGAEAARELPATLDARLREALTAGLADCVAANPSLAIDLACAALMVNFNDSPVRLYISGMGMGLGGKAPSERNFAEALAKMAAEENMDAKLAIFAGLIGMAIDAKSSGVRAPMIEALAAQLPADETASALASHFDAREYFTAAPKWHLLEMIAESTGEEYPGSKPKADVIDRAMRAFDLRPDWLPAPMRLASYKGPRR